MTRSKSGWICGLNVAQRAVVLLGLFLVVGAPVTAASDDRDELWREDIAFYAAELEARHIDLFHTLSRDDFHGQLETLSEQLPELSDPQIVAALMRITHMIGDGHTAMPLWGSGYHRYPVIVRWVDGQAVITGADNAHSSLIGARITRWDGADIQSVIRQLAPYLAFVENSHSESVRAGMYLPIAELGHAIGLARRADTVTLHIDQDGEQQMVEIAAVAAEVYQDTVTELLGYRRDLANEPGYIETSGIRFALLADGQLGYFLYDRYPSYEAMAEFMAAVRGELEDTGTQNIAIDFRESFGGDFFVGLMLAAELIVLDQIDWQNGVYVLQSGRTFSAAMSNSAQFSDILNARRIGEPTGGNPCGYQDMGQFSLPNSGFVISYSKRLYCFAEAQDAALAPDIHIAIQADDFENNEDRALDWILHDIEQRAADRD